MRVAVLSETLPTLGGGEKHGLRMVEPLLGMHAVTVFHKPHEGFSAAAIEERFGLRLPGLRLKTVHHPWGLRRLTAGCDLFLNITFGSLATSAARKQILMSYFPLPVDDIGPRPLHVRCDQWWQRRQHRLLEYLDTADPSMLGVGLGEYRRRFGSRATAARLHLFGLRKLAGLGAYDRHYLGAVALPKYDLVLVNSEYSARWVERNYGRTADILPPAIETDTFRPGNKEPIALSVGRFDPEPNSKKHHVLLAAFKELCDAGILRGWHLWLCGSTDGRAAHLEYIRHLEEQGRGYPVSVGVNLPFARLVDLYGRSSLYWHAMGYGEDPDRHPERFEHFGMTTVEAMAAGCVPMVIAAGGQVEIVTAEKNGFWWSSPEELKKCVARFLEMPPAEVAQMRAAARSRACDFSPDRLRARVTEIYRSLGVPTVDSAINRHRVTPQPATV
jgi:glycosyltransferase involved in cell wall biosynthesis